MNPPCWAWPATDRERVWVPLPQLFEQVPKAVQPDTVQWTGQGPSLHGAESASLPHALPPNWAFEMVLRARVLVPAAQVVEHLPNTLHSDSTQSIGQSMTLHWRVCLRAGHALPPWSTATFTDRDLPCVPALPHDAEHAPHFANFETTQSTGHAISSHSRDSTREGQVYPPCCAWPATDRDRVWVPLPQLFEQVPKAFQPDTVQWTGQGPSLQTASPARSPHAFPPNWALVATVRARVFLPTPQVLVHLPYTLHSDTVQSTGQSLSLHCLLSSRAGQV